MTILNPYQAAGTFTGKTYVVRKADRDLIQIIDKNSRYPYVLAGRQSGKSSLLQNAIKSLDKKLYKCAFIDISILPLHDYKQFSDVFFEELLDKLNVPKKQKRIYRFQEILLEMVEFHKGHIITIFLDEIDALIATNFKDDFFSKIRGIFNKRAEQEDFNRIIFVLAGMARIEELVSNENISPFNVGQAVSLKDLTLQQSSDMLQHMIEANFHVDSGLGQIIYAYTNGSVYLTQLIFEILWDYYVSDKTKKIGPQEVNKVVKKIIIKSSDNIHFTHILHLIEKDTETLKQFNNFISGGALSKDVRNYLEMLRIIEDNKFHNYIYEKVFEVEGLISLNKNLDPWKQFWNYLEECITQPLEVFEYKEHFLELLHNIQHLSLGPKFIETWNQYLFQSENQTHRLDAFLAVHWEILYCYWKLKSQNQLKLIHFTKTYHLQNEKFARKNADETNYIYFSVIPALFQRGAFEPTQIKFHRIQDMVEIRFFIISHLWDFLKEFSLNTSVMNEYKHFMEKDLFVPEVNPWIWLFIYGSKEPKFWNHKEYYADKFFAKQTPKYNIIRSQYNSINKDPLLMLILHSVYQKKIFFIKKTILLRKLLSIPRCIYHKFYFPNFIFIFILLFVNIFLTINICLTPKSEYIMNRMVNWFKWFVR